MADHLDHPVVRDLIARSNELGSDPTTTNYGGGNTSAKGTLRNPATGQDERVLWVKGSGGDLGTLTPDGLSVLRLQEADKLEAVYRGDAHEDEMHDLFSFCALGSGGRPHSIDTSMHSMVPAAHIDHLHPDSIIAFATAADGEELTKQCFGEDVAWLPWKRPGFELGLQHRGLYEARADLRGVVLGGHGLTAWADTSDACRDNSLDLIATAAAFIRDHGRAEPLGAVRDGHAPLPPEARRARMAALAPFVRGLASSAGPVVGHWNDSEVVLDFLSREAAPRLISLGTSCPDHLIRTKVQPLLLDLDTSASLDDQVDRLRERFAQYEVDYAAYYERNATPDSPAMRGAAPAIVLLPGVGML